MDNHISNLRDKKKFKWIIFKVLADKDIIIDSTGDSKSTFADFEAQFPKSEGR